MIATIDVEVQAANPHMPLFPWRAFSGSPSSVRVRNVPKMIGLWRVTAVQVSVTYPNEEVKSAECRLVGGVWIGTVEASEVAGTVENGYSITADGTDENGDEVKGYILGRGDVEIIEAESIPLPFEALGDRVHVYASKPETLHEGDLWHDVLDKCWYVFLDGKQGTVSLDEKRVEDVAARIADMQISGFGYTVYTRDEIDAKLRGYATAESLEGLKSEVDANDAAATEFLNALNGRVGSLESTVGTLNDTLEGIA